MRCKKCGYYSFDYLDACPKCGADWKEDKERFNITAYKPEEFDLLSDWALSSFKGEEINNPVTEEPVIEENVSLTETSSLPEIETETSSESSSLPEATEEEAPETEEFELPELEEAFNLPTEEEISLQPEVLDELEGTEETLNKLEGESLEETKDLEESERAGVEETKLEEAKLEESTEKRTEEKKKKLVSEISEEIEPLDILEDLSDTDLDLDLEISEEDLL
jgi:hypothetical protein